MAATDRLPSAGGGPSTGGLPSAGRRRRWLLAVPLLVVGVLGVALAVGAAQGDAAADLPPLPAAGRDDVALAAEVAWDDEWDRLVVDVDVALAPDAEPLTVTHWAKGDAAGPLRWWPAVLAERLPEGQVVLHVGVGAPQRDPAVDEYERAEPQEETVGAGATLSGRGTYDPSLDQPGGLDPPSGGDLDAVDEVRVCLWEAGAEPPPGGRPAVCADVAR